MKNKVLVLLGICILIMTGCNKKEAKVELSKATESTEVDTEEKVKPNFNELSDEEFKQELEYAKEYLEIAHGYGQDGELLVALDTIRENLPEYRNSKNEEVFVAAARMKGTTAKALLDELKGELRKIGEASGIANKEEVSEDEVSDEDIQGLVDSINNQTDESLDGLKTPTDVKLGEGDMSGTVLQTNEKSKKVIALGCPYTVYITGDNGEEVAEFEDTPVEIKIEYTDDMLNKANITDAELISVNIYKFDDNENIYKLVGRGSLNDNYVSRTVTKNGQYILGIAR